MRAAAALEGSAAKSGGLVVDQQQNPIPGVLVKGGGNSYQVTVNGFVQPKFDYAVSDEHGTFCLECGPTEVANIYTLYKPGYTVPESWRGSLEAPPFWLDFDPRSSSTHRSSATSPVRFVLWKLGEGTETDVKEDQGWFVFGFLSFTPLRWKDAFKLNDNFKSYLALNPLQNFFTTLRFRNPVFDEQLARSHYNIISDFLQLDKRDTKLNSYERIIHPGSHSLESRPNIVLVICESFSMYKSSMSGNPLNSTPFFNKLTNEGIFFERCFSPTFGTARGVFATLTGIPDVQLSKFSTRNLQSLNQYTIINSFEGYNKFYFIGGSSDFNNFRGLITNINDIQVYDEARFSSPKLNVWGISDKNLFLEADKIMDQQSKPFFAIIQTSDNHRPYSIPAEDKDFLPAQKTNEELKKYGFESPEEYKAFCYTDYCFQKFMSAAKSSPYFDNTIFVFVGDHGVEGDASAVYPTAWTEQRLNDEHVPLLFYSPALLTPQRREETVSQIDILPTLASLVSQPYTNKTLGRNLLDARQKEDAAFIIHHDEGKIGIVNNDYYYSKNLWITKEELIPIRSGMAAPTVQQADSIKRHLSELTSAMYETAKWMLVNNHGR